MNYFKLLWSFCFRKLQ